MTLRPYWTPGPCITHQDQFLIPHDSDADDADDEFAEYSDGCNLVGDRLEINAEQTSTQIRNRRPSDDISEQEQADWRVAQQVALQGELNPYGESMRNRTQAVHRDPSCARTRRSSGFRGSYDVR